MALQARLVSALSRLTPLDPGPGRAGARGSRFARTLRQYRHFFRFAALFGVMFVLPAGVLVYFALASLRAEELVVDADLKRLADVLPEQVTGSLAERFDYFERQATDRLLRGQSPSTNLAELSPFLRAAFRFDAEGQLVAPFQLDDDPSTPSPSRLYREAMADGLTAEAGRRYAVASAHYARAAASTAEPGLHGAALFADARARYAAGEHEAALAAFGRLYSDFRGVRGALGFRVGDLAALERAERVLDRDEASGVAELQALVEALLADRWTIGRPGESAVARRALARLEGRVDADWLGRTRTRLDELTGQLFWAGEHVEELELFAGYHLRVDAGEYKYLSRPETGSFWATRWVGDDLYAFSFDYGELMFELHSQVLRASQMDDAIVVQLLGPDDKEPPGLLVRRPLSPWLPHEALAVSARDPDAIAAKKSNKRWVRIFVVSLAVAMSLLGLYLAARLVGSELETARMKADFAANVSHELRSPLTQIRLKAEALLLDLVFDDADRQAHYEAIVRESERLSRLVDNVLDYAAIERGVKRYTLRPEDPGEILAAAVSAAKADLDAAKLTVQVDAADDLPVVWCDREAIGQVLTNLLSNAMKYGADGGWVGITAVAEGDALSVSVADRGMGIAPHDLDRLFEHFFRSADPEVRRRKGTGIGLTIVRYIVEAHGGTVRVHSEPRKGTTFTFTLPLEAPATA